MKLETISRKIVLIGLLTIVLCFADDTITSAAIPQSGIHCMGCHKSGMGGELRDQYQGPEGCLNCHSSSASSTTYELDLGGGMGQQTVTVPVVNYTGVSLAQDAPILAGGNFFWVQTDDAKGHNIFPTNPENDLVNGAPGDTGPGMGCSWDSACHRNFDQTNTLGMPGLVGRQGCTKCHMLTYDMDYDEPKGYHHADDSNLVVGGDPDDTDGYFRFLKGHQSAGGYGVCGLEDDDWEATSNSSDHNEYLGFAGSKTSAGNISNLGPTMTGYCTGCHGNFHIEQDPSQTNWIRHASDAALCPDGLDGCECAGYTTYNPQAPVARPSLDGWTQPSQTVDPETDLAMCLSCHRAHGSPYPKMLRWDFSGCLNCHTNK